MTVKIHKIHWPARYTKYGKDIDFTVRDVNAYIESATHPCIKKDMIGKPWCYISSWLQRKGAVVTLGEAEEIEDINNKT